MYRYFTDLINSSNLNAHTITKTFIVNNMDLLQSDVKGKYFCSHVPRNCDYITNIQSNVTMYCRLLNYFHDEVIINKESIIIPALSVYTNIFLVFYLPNDVLVEEITFTCDYYRLPVTLLEKMKEQKYILTKDHIYGSGMVNQHRKSFLDIFACKKEKVVKEFNLKKDIDVLERNSNGVFYQIEIDRSHNFVTNVKAVDNKGYDVKLHLLLTTFDDSLKDNLIDKSHIIIPMLSGYQLMHYRFYIDLKNKPESIIFTYDNYVLTSDILQKYLKEHYITTNEDIYMNGICNRKNHYRLEDGEIIANVYRQNKQ